MMTSAQIRQHFLDFFKSKQHHIVPSAPIVVKDDPTLLFTNAGMNQFKDYFLGNKKPVYSRVADTQKCLRVSGKHNDLEEVGVDTYHHTMFEMLGNWSFGDYFKAEAISWSWELLTEVYKLDKDRLYVTIFEGDPSEGLPASTIALSEWKKLVPEERILFGNKKDNFWEMGDTGPCGPCSEIHVDCRSEEERKKIPGRELVNKDHPQVIEIWNNVFIQYNRLKDGSLQPLPMRHVDTGMGFERLVRVIQGKQSNYDTDIFSGTIAAVEKITKKNYDAGDSKQAVAFRVLADHIRAISFTIADGQLPSNTGAGYVIRRILRRAVRYYYSCLNQPQPLLYQLVPLLAKQFEHVFPELIQQQDFVAKVIREEEEAFLRTLEKGLKRMDDILAAHAKEIPGNQVFELFDTYGFPPDLTRLIAAEQGRTINEPEFEQEMLQQKNRSRAATQMDTEDWIVLQEDAVAAFVGYDTLSIPTHLVRYRKVKTKGKEIYQLVLEATPFYAESGGQVGDRGTLTFGQQQIIRVIDTKKENNLILHITEELPTHPEAPVLASVDARTRQLTTVHHSATHLLHAALRQVLGTHVAQKGSWVNEAQLRFDFSHFSKIGEDEIELIEAMVNEKIRKNIPVQIEEMEKDQAIAAGAMALFGEKYGDRVRVVTMDPHFSIELCGGTHVNQTGEMGLFKIKHESAIAAGVRRIEAVGGSAALIAMNAEAATLEQIRTTLKNPAEVLRAVQQLQLENAELKKKLEAYEAKLLNQLIPSLLQQAVVVGGTTFIGATVEANQADVLKKICFQLKGHLQEYLVVLVANIDGKAQVAILLDENTAAAKNLDAGKLIKQEVAPLIKGGGGGAPTLATAGGQDSSRLQEVITAIRAKLN
jgi:alanyl-tRNA synthetase